MQTSIQNTFKNVVLCAWKERWSEQKWTMKMRTLLQPGSTADMFQMADVLFTQAFIGSSPNMVLLSYFNYGLKSGTFSYAAIVTAISKHEDLQNVESMDYTLKLLMTYIEKLNSGQILEECMALCRALLLLLQWLLRNIEQYLKGVHDVSPNDADKIIAANCQTLHALTTMPRTASLLTIERFEESSVWSHIETDLAVIKNAAVGHKMQGDVSRSCHSVSQLARCHTKTLATFSLPKVIGNESNHSMLINMLVLLEGEWNKMTDGDTLVQQFLLIAQLCDLNATDLCLDVIRACMMGFLGSIKQQMRYKWCSILFLVLPQHLRQLKSAIASDNGSEISLPAVDGDFDTSLRNAFTELLQYDSLLDMLDQVTGNPNSLEWILDQCLGYRILREDDVATLKLKRGSCHRSPHQHPSPSIDPNVLIKYETTARQLLSVIDESDYAAKQENLLSTLSQMSSNFDIILASSTVSQNVQKFAHKLIKFNDAVKSSTGEGGKAAQTRCLLFDFTFFLVCQIAQQYGKAVIIQSMPNEDNNVFLYSWIASLWPNDRWPPTGNPNNTVEVDDSRVQLFINVLRKGQEQTPSLKKWHDMCVNLPRSFIELMKAWQYGVVSEADIMTACDVVCNILSLAVRLCCLVALEKFSQEVPHKFKNKEIRRVVDKLLLSAPESTAGQEVHFEKRFTMFKNAATILLQSLNHPKLENPGDKVEEHHESGDDLFPADVLHELVMKCRQVGWIDQHMLVKLDKLYRQTGPQWLCHQLVGQILGQTRKDLVEKTVTIVGGIFLLDVESLTICLLRHEIPHYLTHEVDHMLLSAPAGNVLAQLAVSCLAMVLHNISFQQKACLATKTQKQRLTHQLLMSGLETISPQKSHVPEGGPTKLRRLFSSTAEHDLAGGALSYILDLAPESANTTQSKHTHVREPVLRALSHSLDVMHMALIERQPGPHIDFALYFVYLASCCGELVSQAVLQLMPLSMVTELTAQITKKSSLIKAGNFNSLNFALSISDLGHALSRKVAAKAVSQIFLDK